MNSWYRVSPALLVWGVVAGLACMAFGDAKPASQPANDEITLTGTFVWKNKPKDTSDLKATLKPDGKNQWKAVYQFTWGKQAKTFTGTVKGDIKNGEVSGDAGGEGKRTFSFSGKSKDGAWAFDHFETTSGKPVSTGSGTLKIDAAK